MAFVLALAACGTKPDERPIDRAAEKALLDEVAINTPPGMSDLTMDDRGVLWAVAERTRKVIELDTSRTPVVPVTHEMTGFMPDLDTEAIAWLGNGKLAFGVEGQHTPFAGLVFAELRDGKIAQTSMRALTDADLGVTLQVNHGVEALCGSDGELLAGLESVGKVGDKRWAPLVRVRGDSLHVTKLWLTTKKGKLSALNCTIGDDGVAHVTAIERHFGVQRILTFDVGRDDAEVTPTVYVDLWPVLHDHFNMEGIARLHDGRLVTINDNESSEVSGPTELFVFHPR